jgi:hypothetical protein
MITDAPRARPSRAPPMTTEEFRDALARLDLKHTGDDGASAFLGVGERTIRRWASDAREVPDAVAMLLRLMIARRITPARARQLYGKPTEE